MAKITKGSRVGRSAKAYALKQGERNEVKQGHSAVFIHRRRQIGRIKWAGQREKEQPVTRPRSSPALSVDSTHMVDERLRAKIKELRDAGSVLEAPQIDHITINGAEYRDVHLVIPMSLWNDEERYSEVMSELRSTGDSTIHVHTHITRRRSDQEGQRLRRPISRRA